MKHSTKTTDGKHETTARRRLLRAAAVAGALAAAAPHAALADSLAGRILDPQGRTVADARVRLFDRTSGQLREAASSADGRYRFDRIAPGDYVIEAHGSAGALSGAASVAVGGARSFDLTLAVSGVTAEVVVTASSTPRAGREVAKAVDVVGADEIALRNEMSIAEAVRTVPGLRVRTLRGPGSQTAIAVRGLRNQDTALLIDGLRFRDAASPQGDATGLLANLATVDTDRIEVVRGSGSPLYGSNAMAGVVNVISRTGGGPARGELLAEGGGLGLLRAVPSVRGGAANDRLTYSGALAYLRTGGARDDPYRSVSPQGMVRLQFTPALSATGRLWYSNDRLQLAESPAFPAAVRANFPAAGVVPAVALPTGQLERFEQGLPFDAGRATFVPNANDPDAVRKSSFLSGGAIVRHALARGAVYRVAYQGGGAYRAFTDGPARGGPFEPATENTDRFEGRTDTVQARLDAAFGRAHFVSAGYEFERERYFREASGDAATATIDGYSHAVYAQDQIDLMGGRLQVSFGGRVQTFVLPEPTFVGGRHPYVDLDVAAPAAVTGDVAAAYFLEASETKLRLHVGNSFRAPSPFERFGGTFSSFSRSFSFWGDPRLKPERSVSVDGGVDQWLLDAKLQLSATVFHTDLRETIYFDFATFPAATDPFGRFGGYRNTGGGRARGVELSVHASPRPATTLRAAYTWTDSVSETPTIGDDFFGVPGVSKHLFTLTATQGVADRLSVTFDLAAASDYSLAPYLGFGVAPRRFVFRGPVKGDLVVRYDLPVDGNVGLDLYAKVENLFDRVPYENGFLGPGAWAVGGLRVRY